MRYRKIQNRQISEDFSYLFPQLASIYYAGKFGLNVITDSDELIGAPITALIPDINLAIDVCCSKKTITIKEYICSTKGITYVNIPGKLPEIETVIRIRDAFFKTHLYSDSTAEDDLELLRSKYSQWKQKA